MIKGARQDMSKSVIAEAMPKWPLSQKFQTTTGRVTLLGVKRIVANVSSLRVSRAIHNQPLRIAGKTSGARMVLAVV